MKVLNLSLACFSSILLAGIAEASITMNQSFISGSATDSTIGSNSATFNSQAYNGSSIPTHTTVNVSAGAAHSNNSIDWDVSGGQTILSLGMDQQRPGSLSSNSQSTESTLNFSANSSHPYELSGFYNVTDVGTDSGRVLLYANLYDITANITLFENQQFSESTHNEQFTLGGAGGDVPFFTILSGSLTGTLIAGHDYELSTLAYTYADPDPDSGASALGNVTLTLYAVPEPLSVIVWGGAIIGAVIAARRVKLLQS